MRILRLAVLAVMPAALAMAALTINTTQFPNGTVGTQYPTQELSASGGSPPYQWGVANGTLLPPGLSLDTAAGIISGTPTSAGTYPFTLSVQDSTYTVAFANVSITVNDSSATPGITTTTLASGLINQAYSAQLACRNCSGYLWALSGGSLPQGLSLSTQGAISGTPTSVGSSSFAVGIYSSKTSPSATSFVATQNLTLAITAGNPTINESILPVAFQGLAYTATLTGSGGTPPYTWTFLSTSTDGLSINKSTGVISGTPTAAGQIPLNVMLADSAGGQTTKGFVLNVSAGLSILTTSLPDGTIGTAYPLQTLSAGGGQPPYRWKITTGTLPPGLTLDGVFGRISGTPTAGGPYPFTLAVTDNQSNTATANLSINVGGAITITPATLPAGAVGTAYSQALTAAGGKAPYAWTLATGALPAGLALNATTGLISGTPTTPGTASFTVKAADVTGVFGQAQLSIAVTGPVTITTTSLPDATIGAAYSQTVAASGGSTPYSWSITTGTLPAGLTLNATTGVISGTPTAAATSTFTVQVTDARGVTAKQAFTIATATALTVTPTSLPAAVVGTAYTQKFTAAGGKAPYTFALSGTLPAGFTFTASTATIAGTAPAAETGSVSLTVTDASSRTVTLPLTLTAAVAPLTVTPTTLTTAVVGVAYTQKLTAAGGTAPYTFALTLGSLPSGFSFNASTATITGAAAVAESGNFTITVTDASGTKLDVPLTLIANNPAAPTVTVTLPTTTGFMQQLPVGVTIGAAYPVAISGTVSLTFAPSVTPSAGVTDGLIQFASGGTTVGFTIPAGSTTPTFASGTNPTVLTGTTAGTITVTTSLVANGVALNTTTKTIVNASGVPFISNVSFQQTPGGVTVTVVGFSSTREMVSGLFHFAPATGVSFTAPDITVPLAAPFLSYYSTTASFATGTEFTLTVPFTLSTQTTSVVSVTVTLTNSKGASNPVTLSQ